MEKQNNKETTLKEKSNRLSLTAVEGKEGLFTGTKSDGKSYSVRKDRKRYFFPDEWLKFIEQVKSPFLFETLLQTGARIEECLNIRPKDFFWDRNYIRLYVTKSKASKGETKSKGGEPRSFQVSSQYIKKARRYIIENKINEEEKLFKITKQAVWQMMRRTLIKVGIIDYYNFSLHNVRKTSGMWLKTLISYSREITEGEICNRLGHDFNTYLKHYSSPSIFNERDKNMMIKILGDMYQLQ